jgi:hypothetical protein
MEVPATRRLTVTERSPDMEGRRNQRPLESSLPESRRLASTRRSVRARSTSWYSAIPRSAVEDARKCGFPLKIEALPEPIMLNMNIRGESDKQKCSEKEVLMSAVTITTPSAPLCMQEVRQIIVEEDMDHPLIGRPVLDEMGFAASQHLDSVRDKFHLHDFSHIGEELLEMGKQHLGALSKLLLMPADIPEFIEDLPNVLTRQSKKHEAPSVLPPRSI